MPILTLLPNFGGFHRTLQRVRLANKGRLLLRTPGPVPFGTCICSYVETILSRTCHVYGPFEFRTSLVTSILLANTALHDLVHQEWPSPSEVNWLFNVTINDISVIYVMAQMCRRTEEEVGPKVGLPTPYTFRSTALSKGILVSSWSANEWKLSSKSRARVTLEKLATFRLILAHGSNSNMALLVLGIVLPLLALVLASTISLDWASTILPECVSVAVSLSPCLCNVT